MDARLLSSDELKHKAHQLELKKDHAEEKARELALSLHKVHFNVLICNE